MQFTARGSTLRIRMSSIYIYIYAMRYLLNDNLLSYSTSVEAA